MREVFRVMLLVGVLAVAGCGGESTPDSEAAQAEVQRINAAYGRITSAWQQARKPADALVKKLYARCHSRLGLLSPEVENRISLELDGWAYFAAKKLAAPEYIAFASKLRSTEWRSPSVRRIVDDISATAPSASRFARKPLPLCQSLLAWRRIGWRQGDTVSEKRNRATYRAVGFDMPVLEQVASDARAAVPELEKAGVNMTDALQLVGAATFLP